VVAETSGDDLFPNLKAGDLVDFRLIQPVALAIETLTASAGGRQSVVEQPLMASIVNDAATLKSELLRSFEISKLNGVITRFMPEKQVMELRSPYGHTMLITMGGGLNTTGLQAGDAVVVDVLDGLVVDLRKSSINKLSFEREDVILSEDFGDVRKGARVAMATGTAEVVKVSEKDQALSLRGPFGGVHNLDVRDAIDGDPLDRLKVGDFVEFRAIKPIAIAIQKSN